MKKRLTRAAAFLLSCGLFMPTLSAAADSQGLEGFDPENLISDANMYGDVAFSMDADDIQEFLDEKGSACVRGADGSPCLKDAIFGTTSYSASPWCPAAFEGSDSDTAAEVIAKAAQACRISPKVLIVLLQKEQGLVTTHNPTQRAYAKATGFACPDTAPCDPSKVGFATQVYAAASRLQQYRLQPERFNHAVGRTSTVGYHPNPACGSQLLTMATAATAALYNYTPYLPNAAALANPKGTGDQCSAYGNRNFFRLHSEWFGRPNEQTQSNGGQGSASVPSARQEQTQPAPPSRPTPLRGGSAGVNADLTGDGNGDVLLPQGNVALNGIGVGNGEPMAVVDLSAPESNQHATAYPVIGVGWNPETTVSAGDWDSDGYADLMLILGNGQLRLYSGQAGFTWRAPRVIGVGWQMMDTVLGGYDFDGDRHPDLIARKAQTGELYLYSGNGRGGFLGQRRIGVGWKGLHHLSIVPGWLHRAPALAATDKETGRLRIYTTNRRGGFLERIDLGYGWNSFVSLTGIPDTNRDGRGDLVGVTADGAIRTYVASGRSFDSHTSLAAQTDLRKALNAGQAAPHHRFLIDGARRLLLLSPSATQVAPQAPLSVTLSTEIAPQAGEKLLSVGDWDGNGGNDLIVWNRNKQLVLHRSTGDGEWDTQGRVIGHGWHFDEVLAVRDWQGAGTLGLLAWSRASGDLRLYPGNGQGSFQDWQLIGQGLTWADAIANPGNWNGSNRPQLAARAAGTGELYLIPSDDSGLSVGQESRIGFGWSIMSNIVGVGDADGDGNDDIVALRKDGRLFIYSGLNNNTFKGVKEVLR